RSCAADRSRSRTNRGTSDAALRGGCPVFGRTWASRRRALLDGIAGGLAVDQAKDAQGVIVAKGGRQQVRREILVADGTNEPLQRRGADGREANVAACRIRAAVVHRGAHLDAGRP